MTARAQQSTTDTSNLESPSRYSSDVGGGFLPLNPKDAFILDSSIKSMKYKLNQNMWVFIETLRTARRSKIWETLDYESWAQYLAQPEIDLAAQTVDNYLTVLNRLDELKLNPPAGVSITKLAVVAPHLTSENQERLIEMAKTLSRSDLRAELTDQERPEDNFIRCPKCQHQFLCP